MKHVVYYLKLLAGSAIYAVGFNFFLYPNALVTGGITGVSMIINFMVGFPVGIMVIIMNIPIFLVGFRKLGLKYMIDSAFSMVLISVLIDLLETVSVPATENILLAAIFGGLITGLGLGIVFATGATTGGTDIIARILRRKLQHINMGQIILILDVVVISAYTIIFRNLDKAMFSVVAIFIATKIIDEVLYGINYGKLVYIISNDSAALGKSIAEKMHRGVTMLYGEGVYSGEKRAVLLCAIKKRQIVELKKIVKAEDPEAFVIISETREVLGRGFEKVEV